MIDETMKVILCQSLSMLYNPYAKSVFDYNILIYVVTAFFPKTNWYLCELLCQEVFR